MTFIRWIGLCLMATIFTHSVSMAKTIRYELVVRNEKVNLSGKKDVDFALTVNGTIPAPTLEFTEGDDAEILVKNEIKNEEVSIHWHGILLPPEEDGVPYVNTPPIHPGQSRLFKFPIRQSGTFWYHSHTALQEQKGVYGAFVIHPKKKAFPYDKEAVVVLSDWSDENADQIVHNLRKDGDYYQYKKNSVRSYWGALRAGRLKSYLQNEWERMGGMDLSDVGYDAFLINGKQDSQLLTAHPGETMRVRIINAAASTYFYVSMGLPMTVISADGVDIEPIQAKELLMGMAETYDILVTLPEHKNYELRATAQDVTGHASAWIGMAGAPKVFAPNKPRPDLYAPMNHGRHSSSTHGDHQKGHHEHSEKKSSQHPDHSRSRHDHGNHHETTNDQHSHHHNDEAKSESDHTSKVTQAKGHQNDGHKKIETTIPLTILRNPIDWGNQSDAMLFQNSIPRTIKGVGIKLPVETLTIDSVSALQPTSFPKEAPVHDLKLVLGGDMERYVWHINGKTIQQDTLLHINKGEVVRIVFQNETMMHHPMHLHGHFFRVLNSKGEKSPLKHTVDVPPHESRTIEFYANEPGQWMLHCHNLYHMKSGMARVIRYNDYQLTPEMKSNAPKDPHLHDHLYYSSHLRAATNHGKAAFRLMRTWDELDVQMEATNTDTKFLSFDKEWENEGDIVYRRWFSNFLNIFGGGTFYHDQSYGLIGVGYTLPLLIESAISVNHEGHFRIDLEKHFQWTKNVFSEAELTWRSDLSETEFEMSLMYGPSWTWAAGLMFTGKSAGVGAQIRF